MKTLYWYTLFFSVPAMLWAQAESEDSSLSTNTVLERMALLGTSGSSDQDALTSQAPLEEVTRSTNAFLGSLPILRATEATGLDAEALELAQSTNAALAAQVRAEPLTIAAAAPQKTLLFPEAIELEANGAVARFGPHFVQFAADVSVPTAIDLTTPDGVRLRSTVLGLVYFDAATGKSTLLAELKSAVGELVAPDRVLYRGAFDGVSADILYTYTGNSLQQDVIIRKRPPSPKEWGFDPAATRLEVWTEFFDPPQPRRQTRTIDLRKHNLALGVSGEENLLDETLYFGAMRMVAGKAFTLGNAENSVPVSKAWVQINGRSFLVESSPYALLEPQLEALPVAAVEPGDRKQGVVERADLHLPSPKVKQGSTGPLLAAQTGAGNTPGVVLDYMIVNNAVLNINFGADWSNRVGMAAIGVTSNDFWNGYYFPGNDSTVTVTDLAWSDRSTSAVSLTVTNAPGIWGNGVNDGMYESFIYPWNSGNITVTLSNVPADTYHLYLYGHGGADANNGIYEVWSGSTNYYGAKHTSAWGSGWNSTDWDEGQQYVVFRNVAVQTGDAISIVISPSTVDNALINGLQLVPSGAVPPEMLMITNLLNVNFGGTQTNKVGPAAVGLATNDYWNGCYYPGYNAPVSLANLRWSDSNSTSIGLTMNKAPGVWGNGVNDGMYGSFVYPSDVGSIFLKFTNLPSGSYDLYLYGHAGANFNNGIYEVWSGETACGIKATTTGSGWNTTNWEPACQFVLFKNIAVSSNQPLLIHCKRSTVDNALINGLQLAYKGPADSDGDDLPDAWEYKWFGTLTNTFATNDFDSDGLSNLREYQLGLNPTRTDTDDDGLSDALDSTFAWMEDATPQGGAQGTMGGDNWNWITNWSSGGWGGGTVWPYSGQKLRVTANYSGIHQHYFERATAIMRPRTGDVLYAYVNIDYSNPPSEIMLQWYERTDSGAYSWEHRAYWGANSITWGTDGTVSRTNMGSLPAVLPATTNWVRLEVPASKVGLEGKIIEGMAFALYGGRVAWDQAGRMTPDMDDDALLDAWELAHFGNLSQIATNDYDSDGTNNITEYTNGTDPNTISFGIFVTNYYVNTNPVSVQLVVVGGVPSSMAVLVDSTNFAGATWTAYGSNLTVDLGANDAWHTLWVGLRGRLTTSQQTWQQASLYLDTNAPVIFITSPSNGVAFNAARVNVRGNFTETSLKQITVNSVPAFISGTNFDALNVPLVGGSNTLTATAEEHAGGTATASITVTALTNVDGTLNDPVQLGATPVGGFAPLAVIFQATNNAPGTLQQVRYDFTGDNAVFLVTNGLQSLSHTYSNAGQFFPVVTLDTEVASSVASFSSLGGWKAYDWTRLRINVQTQAVTLFTNLVTDPVDLKCMTGTNLYVLSRSTATIFQFDSGGNLLRALTNIGATPTGLDVDAAGNVYVALSGDHQVAKYNPTANSFQLDSSFGSGGRIGSGTAGNGNGQFNAPYDVAISPDAQEIAVSDSGNHRIQRFRTADGAFVAAFGSQGTNVWQLNTPKGLAYDSVGYLYIVDSGNNRIVLVLSGAVVGASGTAGSALGQFNGAVNLGVGSRGIYVGDAGNNRVQIFDLLVSRQSPPFNPRLALGSELSLNQPNAAAPVADLLEERIYIADTGNNRVLLVKLPLDTPLDVWNAMKARLLAGEIPEAIPYYSTSSAEKYRQAYLSIGTTDLIPMIQAIPPISAVAIWSESAQYRFDKSIQAQTITFPIEFMKENGIWRILEY